MKCQDTRKALTNELHRVVEEVSRHYTNQQAEAQRLNQTVSNLKTEKTASTKVEASQNHEIDRQQL